MSTHDSETCDKGISFKCMHSTEAIEMLLSHAPLRYSIKEISGMIDFHRNTVRPAVKDLVHKNKIQQFGSSYYGKTISDHYRTIAKSIYNTDVLDNEGLMTILRQVGRNIVESNLNDLVDESYDKKFNHDNLVEALLHLKMSYPFADMQIKKEEKQTKSGTKTVKVVRPAIIFDVNTGMHDSPNEVNLNIYPCLCDGKESMRYACEMVAGALEGGIRVALNAEPIEVTHLNNDTDEVHGDFCQFYVHATFSSSIEDEIEELTQQGFI